MHLSTLLEMAAGAFGDRVAFGSRGDGLTYAQLHDDAARTAGWARRRGVDAIGLVDTNSDVVPRLLYGAARAGLPFVPCNYRLADDQLRALLLRTAPSVVVVSDEVPVRMGRLDGVELVPRMQFLEEIRSTSVDEGAPREVEDPAILLFTSGTTGEPKTAVLRHRHLGAYVIGTVDFMGAADDEAALVSVPPYHIAGLSAVLSSVYAGRRIVYLSSFDAESWVQTVREESVTHAMVVPTMLRRILALVERDSVGLPRLRHLSYGGGQMPGPVIERALDRMPHVDFVNAYGLTETSSTVAVLGPDDHRSAAASDDPDVRARLGSVGRLLPTVEAEIRGGDGSVLPPGMAGEIWLRGEQVAGEYRGQGRAGGSDGWFPTKDAGYLDSDGYLFLAGRLDDVIVRGAENLSPGEIEDVLAAHPGVREAAVVGIPDTEWGEQVAAAVVLEAGAAVTEEQLRHWVRARLRSSKTPVKVAFRAELPHNEMGKLLRRVLRDELAGG